MNNRETMLKCTRVNRDYMRLPAGRVDGLKHLTALYQRMANQSCDCAQAWVEDRACPKHEPAVDAFWWGIVEWAAAFGTSVGVDSDEWDKVFVRPHREFAEYLLPGPHPEPIPFVSGPPADIILRLDALWMDRVIQLTTKWGLLAHLKDKGALDEANRLGGELRNPATLTYKAYLESDIKFFRQLFLNFTFSIQTKAYLLGWIEEAEKAL